MGLSESIIRRFWKNLKVGTDEECWLWTASKSVHGGYGQLMDYSTKKRVLLKAHRISFEIHNGEIPDGLFILSQM